MVKHIFTLYALFIFAFSINTHTLDCSIQQCSSLQEITNTIENQTLFVFDFDNTLFECVDAQQGSDQWFAGAINYFKKQHNDQAFEHVLNLYQQKHQTALIQPAEACTLDILNQLKKQVPHINVIILTARSIIQETERELDNIQNAPVSSFSFAPFHLDAHKSKTFRLSKEDAFYKNGIMFCGCNKKSEALIALLQHYKLTPKKIVFVDDRQHHVEDVHSALTAQSLNIIGLHYTHLADKINAFIFNPATLVA
ncbi:MAG: hypothetical protein US69_C0007G0040 [candidate division TM6 bacterium GW2011_GWF2_38_10]|nr:MAG: hypothetical protein US69_C0007G0040 [candidate division TM6 bacterium GW2011_GWF2_38_10]